MTGSNKFCIMFPFRVLPQFAKAGIIIACLAFTGCAKDFQKQIFTAAEAAKSAGLEYCGCAKGEAAASVWAHAQGEGRSCLKVGPMDMAKCLESQGYGNE